MQSKVPLYPYSAKDAMKRGEIEKWRESFRENCACAGGIDILIRENFDGMHLKDGTVEKIVELYALRARERSRTDRLARAERAQHVFHRVEACVRTAEVFRFVHQNLESARLRFHLQTFR